MRSRNNGGVIGAYALPTQNQANGVFFIHDAAIYNTGNNPRWPLASGIIKTATGGVVATAADNANYKTHTFTSNGTFTVTDGDGVLEILIVGGGGGGGGFITSSTLINMVGGGGAGGTVTLVTGLITRPGDSYTVVVGAGGTGIRPTTATSYTAAANSGKPSYVTTNFGLGSFYAWGGGYGGGARQSEMIPPVGGGGGYSVDLNAVSIGSTRPAGSAPSLEPRGTLTTSSATGGAGATGDQAVTGYAAGGGAGWSDGFDGKDTNSVKSVCGGDGYFWPRTALYYGAGGPGGSSYAGVNNTTQRKSGLYGNATSYVGVWNYGNQTQTPTDGISPNGAYGVGGGGASSGAYTTNSYGQGGNGSSGTVIFCYRYK